MQKSRSGPGCQRRFGGLILCAVAGIRGFTQAKISNETGMKGMQGMKAKRHCPYASTCGKNIHTIEEQDAQDEAVKRPFGRGCTGMSGDAFKASWPCSLREAHGEAARVQEGAEPEGTRACSPALPLPEPRPERRPRKVDETALFCVCLRVSLWLQFPLFLRLQQPAGRGPGERERLLWPLSPSSPLSLLILLVFLLPLPPAALPCALHGPAFLVMS